MKFLFRSILILLGSLHFKAAFAYPLQEFYRGMRPMAMGNAFTALADDENAVFYNPAGLALNKGVKLYLLNPKADASRDILDSASTFSDISGNGVNTGNIEKLFGKNFYADLSVFPSLQFQNFMIGYYAGTNAHLVARNLSLPTIEVDYALDHGLVTGAGFETGGFSKFHYFRFGASAKWLRRRGYRDAIPILSLISLDRDYLKTLSAGPDSGLGLSLGVQYEMAFSRKTDFVYGMSWLDAGDTRFGSRFQAIRPPSIRGNLTSGIALIHRFGNTLDSFSNVKFAIDGRHLLERNIDPRLKLHFGAELELGNVALQGGVSQESLTAGASIDFWLIRLAAMTYGVQNQSLVFMNRERRYMVQVTLKLDMLEKYGKTLKEKERKRNPRR